MMKLYTGVVEDILDPLEAGRVRVRVFGLHTDDKSLIPTESLPWADVAIPVTSASVSGIGHSPTGLLRGSWVIVFFTDKDEQYPVVLASLPGIPRDLLNQQPADEELTFERSVVTDTPVAETSTQETDITNPPENDKLIVPDVTLTGARKPSEFKSVTSACLNIIKEFEGFREKAYAGIDGSGAYVIGYGTIRIDGKPVVAGTVITKQKAEQLLIDHINSTDLPAIKSNVKVLVTQSMIDALVCISYNIGPNALKKSTLVSDLNSEKYLQAASRFMDWNKVNGNVMSGLTKRRLAEKNLFLLDGIPDATGTTVPLENSESNIVVDSSGTKTYKTNSIIRNRGFTDPMGVYPLYYNEPDTNRLARNKKINETLVFKKEAARDMNVSAANTSATWDQPPIPYNAKYPNNHVLFTESGHVQEFDDTPNSRRIHTYHSSGTFTEIDDNGSQVNRIVGDGFEIYERHGFVHVKGAKHVNVEGAHTLKVGNTLDIEVSGAATINIFNNANLNVSGDFNLAVGGKINMQAGGDINIDSAGTANINSDKSGLDVPTEIRDPEVKSFSDLTVITRGEENAMMYESPEDGDPTKLMIDRMQRGETTKEELEKTGESVESHKVENNSLTGTSLCSGIDRQTEFPPTLVLSPHFTLGKLNSNGTRKIQGFKDLQAGEIACNLQLLCVNILERIYELYPSMIITSGFRRPGDVANSAQNSDHYYGYAADVQFPGFNRKQYFEAAKTLQAQLPYDRILLEYNGSTTWIHVSYRKIGNRHEVFTMNNHKRISDFGEFVLV